MSIHSAHADAFYVEALRTGVVWGVRDEKGFPAPSGTDGDRAMPFWSLRSRAQRVIDSVPAYRDLEPVEIPLEEFRRRWLPGLAGDGLLVGLNWSGARAKGFDVAPPDVEASFVARSALGPDGD